MLEGVERRQFQAECGCPRKYFETLCCARLCYDPLTLNQLATLVMHHN